MHYHIVIEDEGGQRAADTIFETLRDAEAAVPRVMTLITDPIWTPKRYPGRSARRGEVAVFLDRRHRQPHPTVSILRCQSAGTDVDPECAFWGRH